MQCNEIKFALQSVNYAEKIENIPLSKQHIIKSFYPYKEFAILIIDSGLSDDIYPIAIRKE